MVEKDPNRQSDESMALLTEHRRRIDELDSKIVQLLAERFQVVRDVAHLKALHDLPVRIPERIEEVCARNSAAAAALGVSEELVRQLFLKIIDESCTLEDELIGNCGPFGQKSDR
ncbi:MAG: chorismate mutase [Kiloniellales bacterium]|nr:chorismate mutase [Kiloniellales bacterium]